MVIIEIDEYDKKLIIIKQLNDQKDIQRQIERLDNQIWSKPEKQKLNRLSVFSLIASILP